MLQINEKIKKEGADLQKEFKSRTVSYLVGALGLVVGLAWNDAIQSLIKKLFPIEKNGLLAKFIYAIVLTVGIVVLSKYLISFFEKDSEKKE